MLYFIATPIGNLKDISLRALEVLKSVDLIACEDTRHSLKLLNYYEIKKPLVSYHKFNEEKESEELIEKLIQGKNIAVISDAGTPIISDPGNVLNKKLVERGLEFTVIPGCTAFTSALILSGFNASKFSFIGFLPDKKKDINLLLESYKNLNSTLIFYCAPQDINKDIKNIYEVLGNRRACAVKEITKIYESTYHFNLSDGCIDEPKGEYVLVVEGASEIVCERLNLTEKEHIEYFIKKGYDKKEAVKMAAKERGVTKSELYKFSLDIKD